MAITDDSYFDWPVLPEAPSSLTVAFSGKAAHLTWSLHGGEPKGAVIERRIESEPGNISRWERVAKLENLATQYTDSGITKGRQAAYRVRAYNEAGESAYSNIARVTVAGR